MLRTMLHSAVFIIVLMLLCSQTAFSVEEGTEEEQWTPHKAANQCASQACDTLECRIECDQVCATCHVLIVDTDLSGVSEWNPTGSLIYEIYPADNTAVIGSLNDTCMDCHQGHYAVAINHPVEIAYPPEGGLSGSFNSSSEYNGSPEGPYLLCDDSEENCLMSCVTCHKVHPSEEKGHQLISLLRMEIEGSALCSSCHIK